MLTDLGPYPCQRVMECADPHFCLSTSVATVPEDYRMIVATNLVAGERTSEFDAVGVFCGAACLFAYHQMCTY